MKDHRNITSFKAAVDAIPLMGMTTRIDRALRLTQKELFALENGARPNHPKILILLTDGSQTPGMIIILIKLLLNIKSFKSEQLSVKHTVETV